MKIIQVTVMCLVALVLVHCSGGSRSEGASDDPETLSKAHLADTIVSSRIVCSSPVGEDGITGTYALHYQPVVNGDPDRADESVVYSGGIRADFEPFAQYAGCGSITVAGCGLSASEACPPLDSGASSASYTVSGTLSYDEDAGAPVYPVSAITGTLTLGTLSWTYTGTLASPALHL